jgi:hypothetical protein
MKKLLIVIGVMLLAACANMDMSGASSAPYRASFGPGGETDTHNPTPFIMRDFDPNSPYHGG